MKNFPFCAALLSLLLSCASPACLQVGPFMYSCTEDEKIEDELRSKIEDTSMRFVQALVSQDVDPAYALFTADAQAGTKRDELASAFEVTRKQFGPITNLSVYNRYFISVTGTMPPQIVVCGSDLARPQGRVFVAANSNPKQAHVLVGGRAGKERWVASLWLVYEQDAWRVQYFQSVLSTVGERGAQDYWLKARSEKDRGHIRNAAVLYAAANSLAFRSPMFQLGIQQTIQQEMQGLSLPDDLSGQAPYRWLNGDTQFRVTRINALGVAGKVYLLVAHEVEPWSDENQTDSLNRKLMQYIVASFPEYQEAFEGLVIEATERGNNRLYRTAEEFRNLLTTRIKSGGQKE
jgi:hypothetical protein